MVYPGYACGMADVKTSSGMFLPCVGRIPCFHCAAEGAVHHSDKIPMRCKRCGYGSFCDKKCLTAAWKRSHKRFCQQLENNPGQAVVLKSMYDRCGLFTNGNEWFAVPPILDPSVEKIIRAQVRRDAAKMFMLMPALYHMSKRPEGFDAPKQFTTTLQQPALFFHEHIYALIQPRDVPTIARYMAAHGLTHVFDPVAGHGAVLFMLHAFGGIPADKISGSDIQSPPLYWPVRKADALDPATLSVIDPEKTLVVLSWTDQPGDTETPPSSQAEKDKSLSEQLIPLLHAANVQHLLVLKEVPGCAISERGSCLLESHYHCVTRLPDFRINANGGDFLRDITGLQSAAFASPAGQKFLDSAGQESFIYQRRREPVPEIERRCARIITEFAAILGADAGKMLTGVGAGDLDTVGSAVAGMWAAAQGMKST